MMKKRMLGSNKVTLAASALLGFLALSGCGTDVVIGDPRGQHPAEGTGGTGDDGGTPISSGGLVGSDDGGTPISSGGLVGSDDGGTPVPIGSGGAVGREPVTCGGLLVPCSEDEYCAFTPGGEFDCMAVLDATAICRPRPTACEDIEAPVCGCDGETYENACTAAMLGDWGVMHDGPCEDE